MTTTPRPYRSPLRDEQSRATRRRIVDAASELFVERGYGRATIDAIAARAGVGRKTVFTAAGGKVTLLKLAFDWALAGDDEPVAIADRPEVQRMMRQERPAALLADWMALNATIARRVAVLYHVLVVAADADSEAADLLAASDDQRAREARALVTRLEVIGGLRPGLDRDDAAAIIEVLMDPMPYRRLVVMRGWDFEAYVRHVQHLAAASLLP